MRQAPRTPTDRRFKLKTRSAEAKESCVPTPRPLWRRAVDGIEQRLSGPLETLVHHENTSVALAISSRALAGAKTQAERASRTVLHALNIPAASDLFRLLEHITEVEHELRQLRASSTSARDGRKPIRPRALTPPEETP